ncbi:alpha/beta hydrolase [Arsenicicoccus dermatophilus]|uniref:alpha/beta hydrolase n=1 Tax=Arsenicicoccus dermatophilus TaxID=1076331 RepID=UPI001F4C8B2A|nr:alpha/beta hydrolase [Arsenicicoccus dermatophilus]MCH8613123.1 alpha/beta hydrolase [Arsenicicoccus dermatophilus]
MSSTPSLSPARTRRPGRAMAVSGVVLVSLGLLPGAVAAPAPTAAPTDAPAAPSPLAKGLPSLWPEAGAPIPAVPTISWKPCEEASQQKLGLQCATAKVPLDYAHPSKASILLNLVRHKATAPKSKGAVFVNPGGPGNAATDSMGRFLEVLGKPVTSQYDVIGMDPRGIGVDSLAACWSSKEAPDKPAGFPVTQAEAKQQIARDTFERKACDKVGHPIIDHMTTGDVARDMDLVRQAVGDSKMSYYGVSYGTVLGATYAAMFPTKVRGLVLDGVVNPVDWTTGQGDQGTRIPSSMRTGSGVGADESLKAAFAACAAAGKSRCRHGATIAKEWDQLIATLSKGPVTSGGATYTKADTITSVMPSLYDAAAIPALLDWIHDEYLAVVKKSARKVNKPRVEGLVPPGLGTPKPGPAKPGPVVSPTTGNSDDSVWRDTFKQAGVICSDAVNPKDPMVWHQTATAAAKTSWFAPLWVWQSSLCAGWPGSHADAYWGPFDVKPAHPLLVVGNIHDPATPYANAKAVAAMSPGARLLTVDTFGHAAGDQSPCATKAMQDYLLTGALPAPGTVCKPAKPLF